MGFNGFVGNSALFDEMYRRFQEDPAGVDPSWRALFEQMEQEEGQPNLAAPGLRREVDEAIGDFRLFALIEAYRTYGHLRAKSNPIEVEQVEEPKELKVETYGFGQSELECHFPSCGLFKTATATLREISVALKETYCGTIGVEYMGLQRPDIEIWLQKQIEPNRFKIALNMDEKQMILQHLNQSEMLEVFLHTKYVGQKRFSLEGGETLVPMLVAAIEKGARGTAEEYVIGMAHRGRLNVLSNILGKSYKELFSEFEEGYVSVSFEGSGDVKYHKGYSSHMEATSGKKVKVTIENNPSHLESVNAVVEGRVRGRQEAVGDLDRNRIIPILVHGDAALAGQGSVYETLQLYRLKGYTTGGTLHFVINNQIGFTTVPEEGRSTHYCTDIARTFGAPVFHVNAEDPEGCIFATMLAMEIRQRFHCDVFIDLLCYRKYGHNEMDEPAFTQPLEYKQIRSKKPIREIYRDNLVQQGVVEKYMAESLEEEFKKALQEALRATKVTVKEPANAPKIEVKSETEGFQCIDTAVTLDQLKQAGKGLLEIPKGFSLHRKVAQLITERERMLAGDLPLNWGMGELLAYSTLLLEGYNFRLAGQDCARGTFSHRHALWMDQKEEKGHFSLQHLSKNQGDCEIVNSPLSEMACLAFEYGFSLARPEGLTIWEAQFGDFCNGAQVIIDQYITTAEQKWGQQSSLTMLLPHGYEGQGPEHSSARVERFLALAGDENLRIVNPTTPSQLFHLLRRQVKMKKKKPLIVFTPKGLLRLPECVSSLKDLSQGYFEEILDDPIPPEKAKKIYFCSGRIFYDLLKEREKSKVDDMALIRIEQLYPLNEERIKELLLKYKGIEAAVWVQEEPANMGAWEFLRPQLEELLPEGISLGYIGRRRNASPAAGSYALHQQQHRKIIEEVFSEHRPSIFQIARHFKG
ncbi:MAG: 2-oxoglutarate dehydrogenase E1 component [Chlamydiia bacterium]|nr:2-oxoglutarate dehydrogenase E1 component [Chlamydiia bacterium]